MFKWFDGIVAQLAQEDSDSLFCQNLIQFKVYYCCLGNCIFYCINVALKICLFLLNVYILNYAESYYLIALSIA